MGLYVLNSKDDRVGTFFAHKTVLATGEGAQIMVVAQNYYSYSRRIFPCMVVLCTEKSNAEDG